VDVGRADEVSRPAGGDLSELDESSEVPASTTAAAAPMNAASKCLALHQDMAIVQMYGKDELFSLPWKVLSAPVCLLLA